MKMKKVVTNVGKGIKGFGKGSVKVFKIPGLSDDLFKSLGVNALALVACTFGAAGIVGGIYGAYGEINGIDVFETK